MPSAAGGSTGSGLEAERVGERTRSIRARPWPERPVSAANKSGRHPAPTRRACPYPRPFLGWSADDVRRRPALRSRPGRDSHRFRRRAVPDRPARPVHRRGPGCCPLGLDQRDHAGSAGVRVGRHRHRAPGRQHGHVRRRRPDRARRLRRPGAPSCQPGQRQPGLAPAVHRAVDEPHEPDRVGRRRPLDDHRRGRRHHRVGAAGRGRGQPPVCARLGSARHGHGRWGHLHRRRRQQRPALRHHARQRAGPRGGARRRAGVGRAAGSAQGLLGLRPQAPLHRGRGHARCGHAGGAAPAPGHATQPERFSRDQWPRPSHAPAGAGRVPVRQRRHRVRADPGRVWTGCARNSRWPGR